MPEREETDLFHTDPAYRCSEFKLAGRRLKCAGRMMVQQFQSVKDSATAQFKAPKIVATL